MEEGQTSASHTEVRDVPAETVRKGRELRELRGIGGRRGSTVVGMMPEHSRWGVESDSYRDGDLKTSSGVRQI